MKKKNKNGTSHNKQLGNVKFRKKLKLLTVNYSYWKIYQKGSMQRQKGKIKYKYKFQNENDIITAKEKIKQKVQVKEQKFRRFKKRTKFYRQNKIFKTDGNWETTHRN